MKNVAINNSSRITPGEKNLLPHPILRAPGHLYSGIGSRTIVWIQRHADVVETVLKLNEIIKKLEQRNADLIDLSSAAIKYHKEHKEDVIKTDEQK